MAFFRRLFSSRPARPEDISQHLIGSNPLFKWALLQELGDGSFAKVHKAQSKTHPEIFSAVKVIELGDFSELDSFLVEINILAACEHNYILKLYEAYLFDSKLWYFLEFCPGGALDDIIIELDHGLSEPQIICVTNQLFAALCYLHSHKIIHRDIKAGNLLLCTQGTIRLADFGVSCMNKRTSSKHDTFIGTPYWMAPEVVVCETSKDDPYTFSCDIWSAGITIIELAEMNPPYHEMNPMRVLFRIPKADPPTLNDNNRWSAEFHNFLERCLVKDPSLRSTAEVLLKHILLHSYDSSHLLALFAEIRAEVVVTIQDLPEFQERPVKEECLGTTHSTFDSDPLVFDSISENIPENYQVESHFEADTQEQTSDLVNLSEIQSTAVSKLPTMKDAPLSEEMNGEQHVNQNLSQNLSPVMIHSIFEPMKPNFTNEFKYQTLSRMRTFEVDGQVITTRTTRIIEIDNSNALIENSQESAHKKLKDLRQIHVRELKQLQREEQKDCLILIEHIKLEKENKEFQQSLESVELDKRYAVQIERLQRSKQRAYDKKLAIQQAEYKSFCKKTRMDQNKELIRCKDELKRDNRVILKEFKHNVNKTPKEKFKSGVKILVHDLELKSEDTILKFEEDQLDIYEEGSIQMLNYFKTELMEIDIEFINAKHNLLRAKEADIWEMEQSHKQINHTMLKNHLSESFLMRRHQMHIRHQKDLEHHRQFDAQRLDIMRSRHLLERRRMPKQQRVKMRKLLHDYKKLNNASSRRDEKYRFREYEAEELRKMRHERVELDKKLDKEMTDFKQTAESAMIELLSLQNEKKMHLTQQENDKLNERDDQYHSEIQLWRNMLSERKESLEQECETEITDLKQSFLNTQATDITNLTVAPGTSRAFKPRIRELNDAIPSTNIDD